MRRREGKEGGEGEGKDYREKLRGRGEWLDEGRDREEE